MARAKSRKPAKSKPKAKRKSAKPESAARGMKSKSRPALKPGPDGVVLLAGGNPQIPKGEGDAPVQAYIRAVPGWKREVVKNLDAIIEREVPGLRRAVKWNSPFYGVGDGTWFLSMHCFDKYVKVAFFNGASLTPVPPGASKHATTRYLDVRETPLLDEPQFADWVRQASRLPGQKM